MSQYKPTPHQLNRVLQDEILLGQRAYWHVYYTLNGQVQVQAGFDRSKEQCERALVSLLRELHPTLRYEHLVTFAPNPETPIK